MAIKPGDKILLQANLNRKYLPANKGGVIYLQVKITPPRGAEGAGGLPSAICLCLDKSGSMAGDKIEQAKLAALELVHRLQGDDYISLVTFSAEVDVVVPLIQMKSIDRADLERKIKSIQDDQVTELYRGLSTSYEQLLQVSKFTKNAVKRIILLTDGQPNEDPRRSDDEYIQLARRVREMGISVLALGIGSDYNEDLLALITDNSAGDWKHIKSPNDIPTIFAQKLDETKTVIHVKPELHLTLSKDVELKELLKIEPETNPVTNYKSDGNLIKIPLSDLKACEEQVLEATLRAPGRPEGEFRIARVKIAGDDATTIDVIAAYTANEAQWGIENDATIRGDFLLAKTRIKTRLGMSGDQSALEEATQMRKVLSSDPALLKDSATKQEVDDLDKTQMRAKKGNLSQQEIKILKDEMTTMRKNPPAQS